MGYSRARLGDLVMVVTLVAMALIALLIDRTAALDICGPDSADPFGRALWHYGERFDPLVSANPLFLRVMSGISAFVFGPMELAIAYGLWKRRPWVRMLAIVWLVAMLYSMVVHTIVEFFGDIPPPHPGIALVAYGAYVAIPVALAWRLRHRKPFAVPEVASCS